jgi:excisionase family DNA binding protein
MQVKKEDAALARLGFKCLSENRMKSSKSKYRRLTIKYGPESEIEIPQPAVEALTVVLEHLAKGEEVSVSATPFELTTQQAAKYLSVSRPFLINILEAGAIPYRKVGTHRRVLLSDLHSYKEAIDAKRLKVLEELSAQAQELEMGY